VRREKKRPVRKEGVSGTVGKENCHGYTVMIQRGKKRRRKGVLSLNDIQQASKISVKEPGPRRKELGSKYD